MQFLGKAREIKQVSFDIAVLGHMDSFAFQIQLSILGGVGKEKH
jgi:hypothetical protein